MIFWEYWEVILMVPLHWYSESIERLFWWYLYTDESIERLFWWYLYTDVGIQTQFNQLVVVELNKSEFHAFLAFSML